MGQGRVKGKESKAKAIVHGKCHCREDYPETYSAKGNLSIQTSVPQSKVVFWASDPSYESGQMQPPEEGY